jgi:hypothetical protein
MSKGLGALIIGLLAILGGAAFAALLIKNKFSKRNETEFDDFDTAIDDEEFEHFFGDDEDELLSDIDTDDASDEEDLQEDNSDKL